MRFPLPTFPIIFTFSLTTATRIFYNNGTLTGWSISPPKPEHKGVVTEVTNLFAVPPTALKTIQTYDPSYTGRYHSEARSMPILKEPLPTTPSLSASKKDWQFAPIQSYNLAQFIADFSGLCDESFMPTAMVRILGDQLVTRRKYGNVCPKSAQKSEPYKDLAKITTEDWHRVVIQASWKSDKTGFYKLWYDGFMVLDKVGIETTVSEDRPFEFRVGLYANGWHDDPEGMKGDQGTRSVWFDEISIGTTMGDVI